MQFSEMIHSFGSNVLESTLIWMPGSVRKTMQCSELILIHWTHKCQKQLHVLGFIRHLTTRGMMDFQCSCGPCFVNALETDPKLQPTLEKDGDE